MICTVHRAVRANRGWIRRANHTSEPLIFTCHNVLPKLWVSRNISYKHRETNSPAFFKIKYGVTKSRDVKLSRRCQSYRRDLTCMPILRIAVVLVTVLFQRELRGPAPRVSNNEPLPDPCSFFFAWPLIPGNVVVYHYQVRTGNSVIFLLVLYPWHS